MPSQRKKGAQKRQPGAAPRTDAHKDAAEALSSLPPGVYHALVGKKRSKGIISLAAEKAKAKDTDHDFEVLAGGFPMALMNAEAMERAHIGLAELVFVRAPTAATPAVVVALPSRFTYRDCLVPPVAAALSWLMSCS